MSIDRPALLLIVAADADVAGPLADQHLRAGSC